MGNVRLYGATSGYTELAPPAVAGDNTLTLPSHGFGKVLQVVSGTTSTSVTSSTSTFIDTGLTATITPASSDSKIMVIVAHPVNSKSSGNINNQLAIRIFRGATQIHHASGIGYNFVTALGIFSYSMSILDSPATASAVVYKTQFCSAYGTASTTVQDGSSLSTITLIEVAA